MFKKIILIAFFTIFVVITFSFLEQIKFTIINLFNVSVFIENFYLKTFMFIIFYSLSIVLLLPLGLFLLPLSGYLFGMALGSIISSFSISIGLCIIYFIIKKNLSVSLNIKIRENLPKINFILEQNHLNSLFVLRLLGILPFAVQNILSAYIAKKIMPYVLIPLLIMSPWILVMNYIGSKLVDFSISSHKDMFIYFQKDISLIVVLSYVVVFLIVIKKFKSGIKK